VWLEAVVPQEDLSALVNEFTPVTIRLGDDGELWIHEPSDVSLVENVGLRVVCKARLRWSVLGIALPVTLRSLTVLLRPEIASRPNGPALVFKLEIEEADLVGIPALVDQGATELVNRELAAKHVELAWGYAATLSHVFDLPDALRPLEQLALTVTGAQVKSTNRALGLAIQIGAKVNRGDPKRRKPQAIAPLQAGAAASKVAAGSTAWARLALLGGILAGSVWVAYAIGRAR
jgi:hypothetical protein